MKGPTETDLPLEPVRVFDASHTMGLVDEDISEEQTTRPHREKEIFRRRKQRQRRKDERESLRREERELTLELRELKQACEDPVGASRTSVQLNSHSWKYRAVQQREERLKAEEEQKRLVVVARTQATYINNLTTLLRKRRSDDGAVSGDNHHKRPCLDGEMYSALLRDIDTCYSNVDALFVDCGMDELPVGVINSVHRRESDGEVDYIQHLNKVYEPFDIEHTYRSGWKIAGHLHRQRDREEHTDLADPNNTIAVKFRVVHTLTTGTMVSMLQRLVVRRFFRDGAVVHVWKVHSEGEGILRGMHSDETGWCRFRPSSDGHFTFTEICARQVPVLPISTDSSSSVIEDFCQVLKEKVDEDERELTSALENLLLEDVLSVCETDQE
ncbi:hypothetical protein PRNP1_012879 [Phytophthora ramorum]